MINKKITFAVEDIQVVENTDIDTSQFSKLLVDCFSTSPSAHDTFVSEENLRKTAKTILLKPFVFVVDTRFDDLGGHDKKEVPGGFVPHNSKIEFKKMIDGHIMFSVEVLIWKRYSGKLLEYFKRDGNKKSVSVEIEIFEAKEDSKSGLVELIDYTFNAITCLGEIIRPAIPNAQAVLQFSEDFEKAKDEYVFSSKYGSIDFKIPAYMKENAQKALDMYEGGNEKASNMALAHARYIVKNETMSYERMRQFHKSLHNGGIDSFTINLHGGYEAKQWSSDIIEKMDEIDKKELLYLSDMEETKPYEDKANVQTEHIADNYLGMEENKDMAKEKEEEMAAEEEKEVKEDEKKEEEMAAEEKPESKKEEKEDKEEKADNEVSMSLDANLDVPALLEFLKNETKVYRDLTDKQAEGINYAINLCMGEIAKGKDSNTKLVTDGMISYMVQASAKVADLSEKFKAYSEENKSLREFKQNIENKQKQYEVDAVLKEAFDAGMPEDELENCRTEAVNFSLDQIDSYKNMVKAKAFKYFGKRRDNKKNVTRIGLPFTEQKFQEPLLWK